MQVKDLYTPKDVKGIRDKLLELQEGDCAILGQVPDDRSFVLDHIHDSEQLVRGVLERECNAFVGVIENAHRRHLAYWVSTPLPDLLRAVASYLENCTGHPIRHPGWIKKVKVAFNKLNSKQQEFVIKSLGHNKPTKNIVDRRKVFAKLVLDRTLGFDVIMEVLNKAKE